MINPKINPEMDDGGLLQEYAASVSSNGHVHDRKSHAAKVLVTVISKGGISMFKSVFQRLALVLALVVVLGLMAPAAAALADTPTGGGGPGDALAPTNTMQHLNVGQERWYAFHSDGADRDNTPSQVFIMLNAQPGGSARFNVWSTERLLARQVSSNPNKDAPAVGEGTQVAFKDGDNTLYRYNGALVWGAGFMHPVTYYVQVQQTGSQPTDYRLSITGDAVTFPTATQNVQLAANTNSAPAASANNAPLTLPATGNQASPQESPAGSSLDTAMGANGRLMSVKPGQQQWYKISVPGTSDSDAHPYVIADLKALAGGGARFTVWTTERLRAWAVSSNPNKDAPAVGVGAVETYKDGDTTLERYGGDLIWRGDAKNVVTYYILVEPTGSQPAQYQLFTTLYNQ